MWSQILEVVVSSNEMVLYDQVEILNLVQKCEQGQLALKLTIMASIVIQCID